MVNCSPKENWAFPAQCLMSLYHVYHLIRLLEFDHRRINLYSANPAFMSHVAILGGRTKNPSKPTSTSMKTDGVE